MPAFATTHRQLPYLFSKRNTRTSQEDYRTGKRESFLKKSSGILRKGSRFVLYRFLDQYKIVLELRWLLRKFYLSPNAYYNYLKQLKVVYREQKNHIQKEIKYIYYNNNHLLGHRSMRIFLQCRGIHLSKAGFSAERKNRIMRYHCSILGLYDHSIVTSINGASINTELAKETLEKVLKPEKPKEELILHSDQGSSIHLENLYLTAKGKRAYRVRVRQDTLMIMPLWKDFITH